MEPVGAELRVQIRQLLLPRRAPRRFHDRVRRLQPRKVRRIALSREHLSLLVRLEFQRCCCCCCCCWQYAHSSISRVCSGRDPPLKLSRRPCRHRDLLRDKEHRTTHRLHHMEVLEKKNTNRKQGHTHTHRQRDRERERERERESVLDEKKTEKKEKTAHSDTL